MSLSTYITGLPLLLLLPLPPLVSEHVHGILRGDRSIPQSPVQILRGMYRLYSSRMHRFCRVDGQLLPLFFRMRPFPLDLLVEHELAMISGELGLGAADSWLGKEAGAIPFI